MTRLSISKQIETQLTSENTRVDVNVMTQPYSFRPRNKKKLQSNFLNI